MRLNWISVLPPLQSDGATVATLLLPELSGSADIRIFTPADVWDRTFERHGPVARIDPDAVPWARLQEAECTLFVLCDSAGAAAVWRIARQHRGVVVVASSSLGRLVGGLPETDVDARSAVQRFMLRVRGAEGRRDAALLLGGDAPPASPAAAYLFADLVSERALGAVRWGPAAPSARPGDLALGGDDPARDADRLLRFTARALGRRAEHAAAEVFLRVDEEVRGWHGRARGAAAGPAADHVASARGLLSVFGTRVLGVAPSPDPAGLVPETHTLRAGAGARGRAREESS